MTTFISFGEANPAAAFDDYSSDVMYLTQVSLKNPFASENRLTASGTLPPLFVFRVC